MSLALPWPPLALLEAVLFETAPACYMFGYALTVGPHAFVTHCVLDGLTHMIELSPHGHWTRATLSRGTELSSLTLGPGLSKPGVLGNASSSLMMPCTQLGTLSGLSPCMPCT